MRRIIAILSILDLADLIVALIASGSGTVVLARSGGGHAPTLALAERLGAQLLPLAECPAGPVCIVTKGNFALSGALLAAIIVALCLVDSRRSGRGSWFAAFLVLAVVLVLSPFVSSALQGYQGPSITVIVSFVVAAAGLVYALVGAGSGKAEG
jgi:hypothetical protein